jgi:CHAT domain-containing protein
MLGRCLSISAVLLCLADAVSQVASAQSEKVPTAQQDIVPEVLNGRNIVAAERVKLGLERAPLSTRQDFFTLAVRTCVALNDLDCARYLANHDFLKAATPGSVRPSTAGHIFLLWSYIQMATGNHQATEQKFEHDFPIDIANPLVSPVLFADLQLLAARRSRLVLDFESSRDHVEKALAATLTLTDQGFDAARLLVGICNQLLENYDIERAIRLSAAAMPLLAKIPPDSFLAYEFGQLMVNLLRYRKDFAGAAEGLRHLLSALDRLQLKPEAKSFLVAYSYNELLAAEVLRGDLAAARNLLQSHPLMASKPDIIARGYFANVVEFHFALAEEFVRLAQQDRSDTGWGNLLTTAPRWTADPERVHEVQVFGQAAAGLRLARMGRWDEASRYFVEAGKARLAVLMDRYQRSVHSAPLPHWADQVLLEFAVAATVSPGQTPDHDLLLKANIVLSRSFETSPDEVLTSQAIQDSADKKRIVQSLRTIEYQRAAWETAKVAALIKRLSSTVNDKDIARDRGDVLFNADEFAMARRRMLDALTSKDGKTGVASIMNLPTLKRSLLPDEALVFYVPMLGGVAKVCLRADKSIVSTQEVDQALVADARILRAALTAAHPPSVEADSQFPAAGAVRLYKVLFGGLEECLQASRRIYQIMPSGPLEQVPPAALLTELPPAMGAGFDLRAARWLIRSYSFVRTSSIGAFVASKRLSNDKSATLDYLGVGDPALEPRKVAGTPPSAFAVRGSLPVQSGTLTSLSELPETSEELRLVARLFDASKARVLLRETAGEEEFRLQPLSEFDVLHFATHGLIRQELPGVKEPALVLTPNPHGDAFSDGLLTSSQIATLPLRARLVVLSACNSARYDPSIIDSGIQGLATSFAVAGVPTMIASLWPIESSLTRDLIIAAFRAARSGDNVTIADSLAIAMRKHLDSAAARPLLHPRFWAALTVLGDGSMRLDAPSRDSRDLAAYAKVNPSEDEEIISAAALNGDLVSSTIGEWNGKRSPSLVRRQPLDGTTKWEVKDADIGAGPATATDRTIYVGGYLTPSPTEPGHSVPILRRLTPDGTVSWTLRLTNSAESDKVAAVAVAPDQTALALVGPSLGERTGAEYRLTKVDPKGSEIKRLPIQLAGDARSTLFGVVHLGEILGGLAVINRSPLPTDKPDTPSGLGLPRFCVEGDAAEVVIFDAGELKETKRLRIERFNARGSIATADGWLVVGTLRAVCRLEIRAAAYLLKSDGSVQLLWRDASPFDSFATAVRQVGDSYEIVGHTKRSVAIRVERRGFTMPDFSTKRLGSEGYASDEVFSLRLSREGVEQRRDFVGAGLPIIPTGMTATDDHSVIFGSIGSRPLWLSR